MLVGSGIDVIEVARIERILARRGERFLRRIFTSHEALTRGGVATLARAWSVKEATLKALGAADPMSGARYREVEYVAGHPPGTGAVRLSGRAGRAAERAGVTRCHLAVDHDRRWAWAWVVLEGSDA